MALLWPDVKRNRCLSVRRTFCKLLEARFFYLGLETGGSLLDMPGFTEFKLYSQKAGGAWPLNRCLVLY